MGGQELNMVIRVVVYDIPNERNRELGDYESVQLTYTELRDNDDRVIAKMDSSGMWNVPDLGRWTDITFEPVD